MKTIKLQGTEDELRIVKQLIKNTWQETVEIKEVETRVYVVDTHSLFSKPHWELSEEKFMSLAEEQGTVYTLEGFQKDFNIGSISETTSVIRFINVTI